MKGLLDYIFLELEIESLNQQQTKEYLLYLQEILPQITSESEASKFHRVKARLNKRLAKIDVQSK